MFDHDYIESNNIIDRYTLGRLDQSDREGFESHYLNCSQCLDDLELAEALRRDLNKTVAREAAAHLLGQSILGRLLNARVTRGLGLAACLVILIGIPALVFRQSSATATGALFQLKASERGGVQEHEVLNLSGASSEIAFQQEIFADEYSRFRVSLINPETDETVWQDQVLLKKRHIAFSAPRSLFKDDHYRLVIDMQEGDGGFATLDSHELRIVRE